MVLQGAEISDPDDVANVIRAGAQATGCTSGVMKSKDPRPPPRKCSILSEKHGTRLTENERRNFKRSI